VGHQSTALGLVSPPCSTARGAERFQSVPIRTSRYWPTSPCGQDEACSRAIFARWQLAVIARSDPGGCPILADCQRNLCYLSRVPTRYDGHRRRTSDRARAVSRKLTIISKKAWDISLTKVFHRVHGVPLMAPQRRKQSTMDPQDHKEPSRPSVENAHPDPCDDNELGKEWVGNCPVTARRRRRMRTRGDDRR